MDNPYFFLFIASSFISSCYAYTWDIKMDWGLFDKSAGENKFLREEVVYSSTVRFTNSSKCRFCIYLLFLFLVLLLLCDIRRFIPPLRMGLVPLRDRNGICDKRPYDLRLVPVGSLPSVCLELLPSGKRAPEQLR